MDTSFLNSTTSTLPRGLRNNNPGNLVRTSIAWLGKVPFSASKDSHFEQFTTLIYGIRAQVLDLIHDINKGKNTVKSLISEYAPSSENDTNAYINSVCSSIGVTPTQKLTTINEEFLIRLVRSIYKVELGAQHTKVTDADISKSLQLLGVVSTPVLNVDIKKKTLC